MNGVELALDFRAIAPMAICGIGAMVVLMLEIFLARRKTFLFKPIGPSYVSGVLQVWLAGWEPFYFP